jgi:hypothetical protein
VEEEEMHLSSDQVLALAPDASSAAAGKKLANTRHWRNLGQNAEAAWGECQGSALYQVRVELATFAVKCTCPSHKFPCKHGLGLLLLATNATDVPTVEPPDWVTQWLSKRAASAASAHKPAQPEKATTLAPTEQQIKRAEKREALVLHGLDTLDLWMNDLVRNGLAHVEAQPRENWEHQAAQLVDAQAPGMAVKVRRLAGIVGQREDWPEKLLGELGRIALLTHGYRQGKTAGADLREDIRQYVGWNVSKDELLSTGEKVTDDWYSVGQWEFKDDKLRVQHTWLLGKDSRRYALILQYAMPGNPFAETLQPGVKQVGDIYFYPGAAPVRGLLADRRSDISALTDMVVGHETIEEFLVWQAEVLARQPWQEFFPLVLREAVPFYRSSDRTCYIRDRTGAALPLHTDSPWLLLALSGGDPLDFAGEWDGETVRPLGAAIGGRYHTLWRAD